MKLDTVVIVGVGFIGGSIGLELKKLRPAPRVLGVCRREESLKKALGRAAVDTCTLELEEAVPEADLVILCTPVGSIGKLARLALPHLKPDAVLTDVGSTKLEVVRLVEAMLPEGVGFVGGHPLAGSEKCGPEYAQEGLFEGRTVVLTPTPRTLPGALSLVKEVWRDLGAQVRELSPEEHDRILAQVSHLPHLAAAELVNLVDSSAVEFTAGGFKDLTRIAASSPEVWMDIYLSNAHNISRALRGFAGRLLEDAELLESEDTERLRQRLDEARQRRLKLG